MHWIYWILIIIGTFCLMEGFTWFIHRYVMHGFLWALHKDHHRPTGHFFEKNDLFFLVFAIPSWLCWQGGVMYKVYWLVAIAIGVTIYGAAYFLVHDVIIHQRFKWFSRSNNTYVRALRWSHKMHHKHTEKYDGESFGFLLVGRKYWLKVKRDKELQSSKASL